MCITENEKEKKKEKNDAIRVEDSRVVWGGERNKTLKESGIRDIFNMICL